MLLKNGKSFVVMLSMIFLAIGLILTGCSSTQTTQDSSQASTEEKTGSENSSPEHNQEDPADFYKGKKLNFVVPYDPGGGYDEYARMIAPYLEKYTGTKVEVNNLPGAGGMRGVNEVFKSPKDGLTIGIINGGAMVTNEVSDIDGVDYKLAEFSYLGRITADTRVLTLGVDSSFKSIDDIMTSENQLILGAAGLGGGAYLDAVVVGEALAINQNVIHGFSTSGQTFQSIARGETDGKWGSFGSAQSNIESGLVVPVLQGGNKRHEALQDVPTYFEVIENYDTPENGEAILKALVAMNDVGRPVAGPPGIPEERLKFLQEAFEKALHDKEFVEKVEQSGRDLNYANGEDMIQIAKDATQMPEDIKEIFLKAVEGQL